MHEKIFVAEILLESVAGTNQADVVFTEDHIKGYLHKLQKRYDEVLILNNSSRALFIVFGSSRRPLVHALIDVVPNAKSLEIKTSGEAIDLILDVAGGNRWKDMSTAQVLKMFCKGISLAIDAGCMGEVFSDLYVKAWAENQRSADSYDHITNLIKHPVITRFDFHEYSLN